MSVPLVSVVTPTWQRHDMLMDRCVPSVQAQTYPEIEHVIISDGPDPALAARFSDWRERIIGGEDPPVHDVQFRELSAAERGGQYGVAPRLRGLELARGDLIAYLDDDDAYRPQHCAMLAAALAEHPEAGFAYSKMASHGAIGEPPGGFIVGSDELGPCAVGTPMIMHRRELLELATWGPPDSMEDWRLVARWLQRQVTARFVPEVTVDVWPSPYRGIDHDRL
jgi:hypothetical protein